MTTFRQLAYDHLYNNGMFEDDAIKVIELAQNDEVFKDTMKGRWDDDLEGYPSAMKSVFIFTLNSIAVNYIDANMPKAWFREIFAGVTS